jgi:hypothetical protein
MREANCEVPENARVESRRILQIFLKIRKTGNPVDSRDVVDGKHAVDLEERVGGSHIR